jgi:superfamily I DNA/RNA helicase
MYNCENCDNKIDSIIEVNAKNYPKRFKSEKDDKICVCQRCKNCFEESEKSLQEILSSEYKNKLILGGPGTGKTFLFKNVIESLPENSNILVITFINNLIDDLEKRLSEISNRKVEVKTLHSFCKNFLLNKIHPYEYFPELPRIIEDDASLLGFDFRERKFTQAFVNLEKENDGVKFYLSRSVFYNSVGHDDTVYRIFLHLNENNEAIPQYSQVIVDEYQDFNLFESRLIELISQKNKIMIAGDDDQALYRFKFASPDFIRQLYKDKQFKSLFLPFCRRCTSVLVKAASAFISNAKGKGLLNKRIEKEFKCYWPDKFLDSKKYPKIFLGKCSADSVVSKHINEKILSIIQDEKTQPSEKDEPEFLIVGPPRISHYLREVNESLLKDKRIDKDIFEIEFKKESKKLSINEGYEFIKKDSNSNLGWRIVTYKDRIDSSLKKDKEIIRESLNGKSIIDLLPAEYINKHKEKIESISFQGAENLEDSLSKKIKIKLTTYLGAKGLSANHVFVLGLENGIFPKDPNNISDDEACQFIVLLTRARKSLRILSVDKRFNNKIKQRADNLSTLVSMIPEEFFEIRNINASNFNKV